MKALRLLTIIVVVVMVISIWAPAPVYAQPSNPGSASQAGDYAKTKMAKLRVDNRTGGTLYVRLTGPRSYFFYAPGQGKTTFENIEPGKYTIVVTTSACGGSLTYTKNIKGSASLKPFVCRRR
jgi:hypothetical protein